MFRSPLGVKSSVVGMKNVKRIDLGPQKQFSSLRILAKGQLLPHPKMVLMAQQASKAATKQKKTNGQDKANDKDNPSFDPFPTKLRGKSEEELQSTYLDFFPKNVDPTWEPSWSFIRLLQ
jgi:hypothetical protein